MVHETEKIFLEIDPYDLAKKIEKVYNRYGVNISINSWRIKSDRVIFKMKLKCSTREAQVWSHARDVQLRLKLKLFEIFIEDLTIYICMILGISKKNLYARLASGEIKSRKIGRKYFICKNTFIEYLQK